MGVDIQVDQPEHPAACTYFAEPEEALKMERLGNERVAEAVAKHPDRLVGLGSVPMQDAALAAQELERCVRALGLKGVIISSNVNGDRSLATSASVRSGPRPRRSARRSSSIRPAAPTRACASIGC